MLKDIPRPKVENIAVAVVHEENNDLEMVWNVYLVNLRDDEIANPIFIAKPK